MHMHTPGVLTDDSDKVLATCKQAPFTGFKVLRARHASGVNWQLATVAARKITVTTNTVDVISSQLSQSVNLIGAEYRNRFSQCCIIASNLR